MLKKEKVIFWFLILILSIFCKFTTVHAQDISEDRVFIPAIFKTTNISLISASIKGTLIQCESNKLMINYPMRLAEVWYNEWVVLDLAFDPGVFTDEFGNFHFSPFYPLTDNYMLLYGYVDLQYQYYEWGPVVNLKSNNQMIDVGIVCTTLEEDYWPGSNNQMTKNYRMQVR